MTKPRLLDLFSGAGGAARGYQLAGFYVVGVDIKPQPRYAGDEFHQADALTFPTEGFDAIHASPPCQDYALTRWIPGRDTSAYPRLIEPTRERLQATGLPFVIENTPPAPLLEPLVLCGSMFGLRVRRHRKFETHPRITWAPASCNHTLRVKEAGQGNRLAYYTKAGGDGLVTVAGHLFSLAAGSVAMGIDWMTRDELAESIPPAFTQFIGTQLMASIEVPA